MYHYSITGSNVHDLQCHLYPEKEASQLGAGHMRIIFRTQLRCHGVMKLHFQVRPPSLLCHLLSYPRRVPIYCKAFARWPYHTGWYL
jgi:hypothetical protein